MIKHKERNEIKLGKDEYFTDDVQPGFGTCPDCGGILVTHFIGDMNCTFCVDCDYEDYDYD